MIERFTADQARKLSTPTAKHYDSVIDQIKKACEEEKNIAYYYQVIDKTSITMLEQDGFEVDVSRCQREGNMTTIMW
jgi:uridylate kinase